MEIASGEGHVCARLEEGGVRCWGNNVHGQLGDGTREPRRSPVQVPVEGAAELCAGRDHSCARLQDGTVSCWGLALEGQLGDGESHRPEGSHPLPVAVSDLQSVTGISCGSNHTCALLQDGTVRCWGSNDAGQLGSATRRPIDSTVSRAVA